MIKTENLPFTSLESPKEARESTVWRVRAEELPKFGERHKPTG